MTTASCEDLGNPVDTGIQKSVSTKLNAALARAQGKFSPPAKNRIVDFTDKNGRRVHYNYADLAGMIEAIRKPMAEEGLSFVHRLTYNDHGAYGMRAELRHESGETLESWYPLPDPTKQQINPKEFGSALTYGRRYSLEALIGIASQEEEEQDEMPSSQPFRPAPRQGAPERINANPESRPPEPQKQNPIKVQIPKALEVQDVIKANGSGTWKIPNGPYRGLMPGEVPREHLVKYYDTLVKACQDRGVTSPENQDVMFHVKAFLDEVR